MSKVYVVKYVGDDSQNHEVRVEAEDHTTAVGKVKKCPGVDFVVGVRRSRMLFNAFATIIGLVAIAALIYWLR